MNFKATGLISGEEVTFTYESGKLHYPPEYKLNVDFAIFDARPYGSYFIHDENKPLDAYLLVNHHIFDEPPKIELDGEAPTLPCVDGTIY